MRSSSYLQLQWQSISNKFLKNCFGKSLAISFDHMVGLLVTMNFLIPLDDFKAGQTHRYFACLFTFCSLTFNHDLLTVY